MRVHTQEQGPLAPMSAWKNHRQSPPRASPVPNLENLVNEAALLAALKESLPPFMQPNTAVQLDEMPLNKNGKIDRTALAALTKKWSP